MHLVSLEQLSQLIATYGYLAVFAGVAIESTGIPFPGETTLLIASIYAGTTHHLGIALIIAAAAAGAIAGDNLGFFVGREGGYRLVLRFGARVHLSERKLKLGQYLFMRHGGKVVFFGRFVSILRAWSAFLAGVNRMTWRRFLVFNGLGGVTWATIYGLGGYMLGNNMYRVSGSVGLAVLVVVVIAMIGFFWLLRRNEQRLEEVAERALPGPLALATAGAPRPGGGATPLATLARQSSAGHAQAQAKRAQTTRVPPKAVPPKAVPPKAVPPKAVPPKAVPPKGAHAALGPVSDTQLARTQTTRAPTTRAQPADIRAPAARESRARATDAHPRRSRTQPRPAPGARGGQPTRKQRARAAANR